MSNERWLCSWRGGGFEGWTLDVELANHSVASAGAVEFSRCSCLLQNNLGPARYFVRVGIRNKSHVSGST
jgi:hypothetical protein